MISETSTVEVALPDEAAGWRLDRALAADIPTLSRERLKALVGGGRLSGPAGTLWDPALKVKGGEALTLVIPEPRASATLAEDIPLTIVFEDEALLVVDKPAGLVVHPAAGNFDIIAEPAPRPLAAARNVPTSQTSFTQSQGSSGQSL